MKIVALEAENIKHLRVVRIEPDGSLVVIGGDNSEGKTCLLDSIEYALGGAASVPSKPIRNGQKKARIVVDLGDIVVTRTFNEKGTNLTVKNKDGAIFASPQAMLDKLVGELAFDPLEFSRMDRDKQAAVLKKLVGLNLDKMKADYKSLYEKRTGVNRQGKELKAKLDGMTKHDGIPEDEVSIDGVAAQYSQAIKHNNEVETGRSDLAWDIVRLKELEKQVVELQKKVDDQKNAIAKKQMDIGALVFIDADSIKSQMADTEGLNRKVRENNEYVIANSQLIELRKQSGSLNTQMEKLLQNQAKALAKAKFPVEGLGIDDDGVTFEDIPFDQCSSAQRIRISVAMGISMNPKLRVLLIREGSLLDSKNLAAIAKMAEEADVQIWMERVGKGKECQVIIENGEVLEPEASNV